MPSSDDVIIAAAGSGKTELLLEQALSRPIVRTLLLTYTNENLREITARLWLKTKGEAVPITAMTWFECLLRGGVKPYQSYMTSIGRVRSMNFVSDRYQYAKKSNFNAYYVDSADNLYSDTVADLAYVLKEQTGGKVIARLEGMYDQILIDEMQDLAGYHLDMVRLLLRSRMRVVMVGDPRQAVYQTKRSGRNSQFRGRKVIGWITAQAAAFRLRQRPVGIAGWTYRR